jgi:hypothetical protein
MYLLAKLLKIKLQVLCNLNTWELAFKCYQRIIARTIKVWIVGSSIVKDAFIEARRTPGGVDLGL